VTFALFAEQNLTGASYFKAFGDGRSGFGLASFAGHGSGVLGGEGGNARFFEENSPLIRSEKICVNPGNPSGIQGENFLGLQ